MIIVNGLIINSYDLSGPALKEDDDILVFSVVDGG